jgi:hypothetical protein
MERVCRERRTRGVHQAALEVHLTRLLAEAAEGWGFLADLLLAAADDLLALLAAAAGGSLGGGLEGLDREGDAAVLRVDLEDLDADDLIDLDHVVDPGDSTVVEFGDVDEALDARAQVDERAELGDLRDLARHFRALLDLLGGGGEGVALHLLHAQGDAVVLDVELEDAHLDALAFLDVLFDGLLAEAHAVVGEVGEVDQAVDAADVDERAEGHDLADGALDGLALGQRAAELGGVGLAFLVEDVATGEHDVAAADALDADDLALELLADEDGEIGHAVDRHLAGGHEGRVVGQFTLKAALADAGDAGLDDLTGLERFPRRLADRAGERADEQAFARLELVDHHLDGPAHRGQRRLVGVLHARDDAELLGAELEEDVGWPDGDDGTRPVLAAGRHDARTAGARGADVGGCGRAGGRRGGCLGVHVLHGRIDLRRHFGADLGGVGVGGHAVGSGVHVGTKGC